MFIIKVNIEVICFKTKNIYYRDNLLYGYSFKIQYFNYILRNFNKAM